MRHTTLACIAGTTLTSLAFAQGTQDATGPLASYFGFDPLRVLVVDDSAGPVKVADINNDGLDDLLVVNDSKSRIEFHIQRATPRTTDEMERDFEINELPPSPYFDRETVTVQHAIFSFELTDVNNDGLKDIIYAGRPAEIVTLTQTSPMRFEITSRKRERDLTAGEDGLTVANVQGDANPELLALVDGEVSIWTMNNGALVGEPTTIGNGINRFWVEDYDGNGMMDILAAVGDGEAPLRLWLQTTGAQRGATNLGAEIRFDIPAINEAEPVRINGKDAASIAVIERASRRVVLYELAAERVRGLDTGGERDANLEITSFSDSSRDRSIAVGDITGDGLEDVITASEDANAVVLFKQSRNTGLDSGSLFSSFKEPKKVALGQWDNDDALEVFVLSEEESIVGVSNYDPRTRKLEFPQPINLNIGDATPLSMTVASITDSSNRTQNAVFVTSKQGRDLSYTIATPAGVLSTGKLDELKKAPEAIITNDFDNDGVTDYALLIPNDPLVMIASSKPDELVYAEDMPQFGLVESAGPNNTVLFDVNGDGTEELVFATENFIRAAAYDAATGWSVVDQITLPDASTSFTSLTLIEESGSKRLIASDSENDLLIAMTPVSRNSAWEVSDTLLLRGMNAGIVKGGSFDGASNPGVLVLASDAFGLVQFSGLARTLESAGGWRSDEDEPRPHEIEVGDINSDGFTDIIVLDDADKLCQIFSISQAGRMLFAMEFKVFEERLFMGGQATFEPSYIFLGDVSGDGQQDLILQAHDRFLIYPQGQPTPQ